MNQRMKLLQDEVAKYSAEIRWSAIWVCLEMMVQEKNLWFDGGGRGVDDEEMSGGRDEEMMKKRKDKILK